LLRIVHCLIQYFPEHVAGTEVYTHTLARMQQASGHSPCVVKPHIAYYTPGEMCPQYQYDGIDVFQFLESANPTNRLIYSGQKKPEGLDNFRRLLLQLKPDVVHFHELNRSIGFTIAHVKIAREMGAKVFVTMHLSFYTCNTNTLIKHKQLCLGNIDEFACSACSYSSRFNLPSVVSKPMAAISTTLYKIGTTQLLSNSKLGAFAAMPVFINRIKNELQALAVLTDKIICLTDWYKNILLLNNVPASKVVVIKQGLAAGEVEHNARQSHTTSMPLKVVFLGRIQTQKGAHLILEAARTFTAKEVVFDIYGKEENSEYYRSCIEKAADLPNVCFKGLLQRETVIQTLADYDLLCLPSMFSEMSPLVIQEAFAARIPVLASKVYGNMEQVKHGVNGLLFDFNSSKSLAEQVKVVLQRPDLLASYKHNIQPTQNFKEISETYLKLYELC
jgi:glycosyltransferase involved in cell wall biosynthesis